MKNTITDYSALLTNDFIPRKKYGPDYSRHRFNPGNPNELEFTPTPPTSIIKEEKIIAANVDDNGASLHSDERDAGEDTPGNSNIF